MGMGGSGEEDWRKKKYIYYNKGAIVPVHAKKRRDKGGWVRPCVGGCKGDAA